MKVNKPPVCSVRSLHIADGEHVTGSAIGPSILVN